MTEDTDSHALVVESEKTLSEMKQKLRNLREALYDADKLKKLFEDSNTEEKLPRCTLTKKPAEENTSLQTNIEICLEEIQAFDEELKRKNNEIKEARLSRMHQEEEAVEFHLAPGPVGSDAVRHNSRQFIQLVCGLELPLNQKDCPRVNSKTDSGDQNLKRKPRKDKQKDDAFIKRNIELAKCSQGILSLTDQEKLRLRSILQEGEEPEASTSESNTSFGTTADSGISPSTDNVFVLSHDTKSALDEINSRLEVYDKLKNCDYYPELLQSFIEDAAAVVDKPQQETNTLPENRVVCEVNLERKASRTAELKTSHLDDNEHRLRELDKQLAGMSTVNTQDIHPLSEEEIHILIGEAEHWDQVLTKFVSGDGLTVKKQQAAHGVPLLEDIQQLVDRAKHLMPNFKYRFDG